MKRIYCIISLVFLPFAALSAASVRLGWDANCNTNVLGYNLYWGSATNSTLRVVNAYTDDCGIFHAATTNVFFGAYTNSISIMGRTNTTGVISNLVARTTYNFAVTSKDGTGLESDFSNEVTYTVPNPTTNPVPVVNLKFK